MKKKFVKNNLEESLDFLNKLITPDRTAVFREPIVPSDCKEWNRQTADYIRDERLRLYVASWIIPRIEKALKEVSK